MAAPLALPVQHRAAAVRAESFDASDNTIEVIWTTGAKVRRVTWMDGPYDEELEVSPKAIRLERLNAGAPFLNTHAAYNLSDVIGTVVPSSARIVGGKGLARIQLSDAPADADIVAKIKSGVIRNVSVGYRVHTVVKTERDGDVPLHTVTDWEPLELSAVPIPADPGAQVRTGGEFFPVSIIQKEGQMPNPTPAPAVEAERVRADIIADLATRTSHDAFGRQHVAAGTSVDEFRKLLLDKLATDEVRNHPGGPGRQTAPAQVTDHSFDQRRAQAMEAAILHRAAPDMFKLDAGAEAFMGLPLLELARASLEAQGRRTAGLSKMNVAAEALAQRGGGMHSTSDFSHVLGNVVSRTLRAAYEAAPQTFRPFTRETTVPDFREVKRAQLSEAPAFEKVNEHGEFKSGAMTDAGERFKVETFGRIVAVTRQVIVNDDLDAFTRLPRAFGIQAAQLESDIVWAQLLGNPTMGDGTALFHANHKNLLTAGALSEATLSDARLKMGLQTGLDGKTLLNLSPAYLMVPKALQTAAEKLLAVLYPAKAADALPASLRSIQVISEPRLDAGIARYNLAGSPASYYFAADLAQTDIVELAYLEGARGVYTETRQGFEVDGLEVKCRLDVGAKVIDWRGLAKNAGA